SRRVLTPERSALRILSFQFEAIAPSSVQPTPIRAIFLPPPASRSRLLIYWTLPKPRSCHLICANSRQTSIFQVRYLLDTVPSKGPIRSGVAGDFLAIEGYSIRFFARAQWHI